MQLSVSVGGLSSCSIAIVQLGCGKLITCNVNLKLLLPLFSRLTISVDTIVGGPKSRKIRKLNVFVSSSYSLVVLRERDRETERLRERERELDRD